MSRTGYIGVRIPWRALARVVVLSVLIACDAAAQSATSATQSQFNPEVDAHIELPVNLSLVSFAGWQRGTGYPYQQWYAAAALGYRYKRIRTPHMTNIDPEKEASLVLGGGYEYLTTTQSGSTTIENRVTLQATPGMRFFENMLVRDRNRVELRWRNGRYSTTYRNQLSVEWDFLVGRVRFSPYGAVEAFYDGPKQSWNEWWYTAGVQFPFGHHFMLDAYYRREDCPSCTPPKWNVAGLTLNYYGDVRRQK